MTIHWQIKPFSQLTTDQLFELLKLRVDIFVVEQQCPYPELDPHDRAPDTRHLLGYDGGRLVACARLLGPRPSDQAIRIGRVAVAAGERGRGLGRALMETAIDNATRRYPAHPLWISAQSRLEAFYRSLGFQTRSTPYLEDGIEHIDMRWQPA